MNRKERGRGVVKEEEEVGSETVDSGDNSGKEFKIIEDTSGEGEGSGMSKVFKVHIFREETGVVRHSDKTQST